MMALSGWPIALVCGGRRHFVRGYYVAVMAHYASLAGFGLVVVHKMLFWAGIVESIVDKPRRCVNGVERLGVNMLLARAFGWCGVDEKCAKKIKIKNVNKIK